MPGFFEQMCKVIAESEGQRTGIAPASEEIQRLMSDLPRAENLRQQPAAAQIAAPEPSYIASVSGEPGSCTQLPPAQSGESLADLGAISAAVGTCSRCPLCRTRKNPVCGEGNPDARLMFIGEGPGMEEDIQGRPFVGKAGHLLDKMICAMQFSREEVYITNIVKCRPPDNRMPTPEEAQFCLPYLRRQIELIRPEVIVLLGATAVKYLLNVTTGISKMRGRWLSYENIPVMATFHPAFLLRQESAKRETWNDLQQVMARFGKFHKPGNTGANR